MVKHAHAEEDKKARRQDILAAALAVFLEDTRHLPSVAAIASKASLAKGTIYLYFETKEQIFAALLSREWDALLADVASSFAEPSATRTEAVDRFIDRFASFLASHEYFLRLDSLGYGHLEANLPLDEFWHFKQAFTSALERAGKAVDMALVIPHGLGLRLLIRSYALTRGLWQTLDLPERLREDSRFASHPIAQLDYNGELRAALQEYWRGAFADRSC